MSPWNIFEKKPQNIELENQNMKSRNVAFSAFHVLMKSRNNNDVMCKVVRHTPKFEGKKS